MNETLTIRNFGPIDNMTLELRVVNILIGDQGTGKSTVAKLLSAIKEVSSEIELNISGKIANEEQKQEYFLNDFKNHLETYGIINYLKPESYIEFNDSFKYLKYDDQNILVEKKTKERKNKNTHVIGYIPAYREAAVLLKDDLNAIFAVGTTLPKIFYYFGQRFSVAKNNKSIYNYTHVLGVEYKYVNSKDIIVLSNGKEILISEASSAINSGIPLLIVFDNAVESMYTTNRRKYIDSNCPYIIIEEPELNCFPTTQKKMMEHFIRKMKYETLTGFDYYCKLVITTHSPYVLTSLNNLMYAYEVGQKHQQETNAIIDKKYWINPNDVSGYMLLSDGTCEEILDREENLIRAEKIDGVSGFLNEQFDALLNIELVPK